MIKITKNEIIIKDINSEAGELLRKNIEYAFNILLLKKLLSKNLIDQNEYIKIKKLLEINS